MLIVESEVEAGVNGSELVGLRRARVGRDGVPGPDRAPDFSPELDSVPRPHGHGPQGPSPGLTPHTHDGGVRGGSDPATKRSWWRCGRKKKVSVDFRTLQLFKALGSDGSGSEEERRARKMSREREIVSWVARLGAVSVEQIARRFGVGRSVAYEQVRRLVELGLTERTQTAIGDPTLISATKDGITYAGLGLRPPTIRIGEVDHWLTCADVAISLEQRYGAERLVTERELRFDAQLYGKPVGAAKLGETLNGYWRLHWPGLAVRTEEGLVVYEVELTPKAKRRLEKIVRAWKRSREIERCVYLCLPSSPTQQVVHAAVRKVCAEDRVRVAELRRVAA